MQVELTFSPQMKLLLDGGWISGLSAEMGKEVLHATIGPAGLAARHLAARQGKWPAHAKKTLKDTRKKDKRKFVNSGTVKDAISSKPDNGKLVAWGGSADMYHGVKRNKRKFRYSANGVYALATVDNNGISLMIGFNGELKHSKEFNRARKQLALERGLDLSNIPSRGRQKAINRYASVSATESFMRDRGIKGHKFAAKGAIGIDVSGAKPKMIMAHGKNNLAYANIVQAGPFAGIRDNASGKTYSPKMVPIAQGRKLISNDYFTLRGKQPRPLLPYDATDTAVLQAACTRATENVFRAIEGR